MGRIVPSNSNRMEDAAELEYQMRSALVACFDIEYRGGLDTNKRPQEHEPQSAGSTECGTKYQPKPGNQINSVIRFTSPQLKLDGS
jgi:hypothetical protein